MNKGRRQELKMLKYKKRLRQLNLIKGDRCNYYAYRSHGSPCSCFFCSPYKYKRAKESASLPKIIDFELNYDAGELEFDFSKGIFVHNIEDEKAHNLARDLIEEG